jgi:predicted dithiol-disulfide oxidoreductase (DUF899 family)
MTATATTPERPVVSPADWLEARKALLAREKELTHLRDEVNRQRLALPWVKVEKNYVFDGPSGKQSLGDLFEGRDQLIVYHFMFGPGWEEGCPGCSFVADHIDAARQHLEPHGVSFAVISRAPWTQIEAFQKRMAWRFHWVSSNWNDFNSDFHVSFKPADAVDGQVNYNFGSIPFALEELPGASSFYRNAAGEVFHTYSCYARGGEAFIGTYNFLDIAPLGRNETGPNRDMRDWLRHHDRYPASAAAAPVTHNENGASSSCGCGENH